MLEAMGGSIRAEGNPERGARLAIWLPSAEADEVAPTEVGESGQEPNHERLVE
jgi:K+-sensing histidine kinase KdpD